MAQFDKQFLNSRLNIKDEWQTPKWIFQRLNTVFGFTIDAAATRDNRKCRNYWTIEDDGLSQPWVGHIVFCNPPYSDGAYKYWVARAKREFIINSVESALVLPFKPETRAFKPIWMYAKYLVIPYRRIKYEPPPGYIPPEGVNINSISPTFPSCIACFTHRELITDDVIKLSKIGRVLNLHTGYLRV